MAPILTGGRSRAHANGQARIEMEAPAKLNLVLRIIGQRSDGYHEIESLFVPVALYDSLKITRTKRGIVLFCKGRKLPEDHNNLVYRAAHCFFLQTGIRSGAEITLTKRIPISAGLGGGSSDAAATLMGLNVLWDNPLSEGDLKGVALSLGADVPFFLLQKPAVARGIGEILEPIDGFPEWWYAIVSPELRVSTEWAYKMVRLRLTGRRNGNMIEMLDSATPSIPDLLFNDLESVTLSKYPFLSSIKAALKALGALGALMTGSGPSIFGVFDSENKAHEAGKALLSQWREHDVFVVKGLS